MSNSRLSSRTLNRQVAHKNGGNALGKRGSTPDARAERARLNPYKGPNKSAVARWVWNQLSKTKHADIFGGERYKEIAREIAHTKVSQAAMDLIVGTEGLNDLSCLGLKDKVEYAEFSIIWRQNRFSAVAGSGSEVPSAAVEARKFLGHQQSAAANFLRSEFEAYDERTLVSTLVFGVATSLFATVISGLEWYSRELDVAGGAIDYTLKTGALLTVAGSTALSFYGITITLFMRNEASKLNGDNDGGPVMAANYLHRLRAGPIRQARNSTQYGMMLLIVAISMLLAAKMSEVVPGKSTVTVCAALLVGGTLVSFFCIWKEMQKHTPTLELAEAMRIRDKVREDREIDRKANEKVGKEQGMHAELKKEVSQRDSYKEQKGKNRALVTNALRETSFSGRNTVQEAQNKIHQDAGTSEELGFGQDNPMHSQEHVEQTPYRT